MTAPLKTLTPNQKTFFDDNGYLFLPGLYNEAEMEEMRAQFHDLIANTEGRPKSLRYSFMDPDPEFGIDPYNPKNVRGIMDQTLANDYWFNNFTDPRVVNVLIDLFGPNIDFHNGKVRSNPPGFVNTQSWHQDWPYERHTTPDLAAAIVYLDDTDVDQGATSVIPGSHKRGEWKRGEDSHTVAEGEVDESQTVTVQTRPGDVLFIHVQVVHAAGHNYTKQSRHKLINEYKTHETVDLWGNKCAFAGLPLARNGKIVLPQI
ncbi:MAG: phytanoyl-CoA dioxygenase family protein [bacterium]|nr:phytanoyl-CoA dioxygenase family protein [bacterium]